jgi:hypothetical protein
MRLARLTGLTLLAMALLAAQHAAEAQATRSFFHQSRHQRMSWSDQSRQSTVVP